MMNHKIRIKSDKYKGYLEKQKEMMKDMGMDEEAMEESLDHCVPVDLYGKRVNLDQNDSENFEETAEDIKEVYGLNDY